MEYYKNFMCDAVVRVDGDRRFAKSIYHLAEHEASNPDCVTTFGGEGFGVFYILEPITKEQYDTFGYSWSFGRSGEIEPIKNPWSK